MITFFTILIWLAYLIGLYFIIFWVLVFLEPEEKPKLKEMKEWPNVTIGIPAYNEEKTIRTTIESVLEMDYPKPNVEIIVVNDGSKDRTSEIVKDIINGNRDYNIKLINQVNKGKGAALNIALEKARGDYFICLDADSFVAKDALKKILPHFTEENIAVVLPLMKVKDPTTLVEKIQWCEYLINFFYKKLMSKLDCIQVSPGPFSVYKKNILKKIGGFDDKRNLTEDLEISLRLQKYHYRLVQLLDAEVYTIVPKTLKALYKQRNRWYKGIIFNALKYRELVFNRKYGDFGLIQMPRVLLSGILAVLFFFLTVYRFVLRPISRKIYELSFINFNFIPTTKVYFDRFNVIDLNYTNFFYALVIFSLVSVVLINAYRKTREPLLKYGPITIPTYLLFYSLIASIAWTAVIVDILRNKRQKW